MPTMLSDVLNAAQLGASMVYHQALNAVPDVHDWSTAHPELLPLLDKGAAIGQEVLAMSKAPGAVAAVHVLGFLRQLAAQDATVPSLPSSST